MENCLYRGETICTYDLKDDNGYYYEELVLEWKQAAADRLLRCQECGSLVYLAAGLIREPYFAHYDLLDCEYSNGHETEELKKCKRLVYSILRRSFPQDSISARYRHDNGMYSTIFYENKSGRPLAVDIRLQNDSLERFRNRDTYYKTHDINVINILGIRQFKKTKQIDWYQNLIQSSQGYLAFIDSVKEVIILMKSFSYRLGNQRRFAYCSRKYTLRELVLDHTGSWVCDFYSECERIERSIIDEKEHYQIEKDRILWHQEQLSEAKELSRIKEEAYVRRQLQAELDPILLEKCRKMIQEGNAQLVSKKYYDAIMNPIE